MSSLHNSLLSAVGINSAITTVRHFEIFEVGGVPKAEGIPIVKIFSHTAFPSLRKLNPVISNGWFFFLRHRQHQLDRRVRQLIAVQTTADHAFLYFAFRIEGPAFKYFPDKTLRESPNKFSNVLKYA
ncbi:hypothetical protein [Pseudomonas lundensis]|uniref:hypothetical protein n=1 Tax=Pseudomonas lundensis TaxID=86185 RepID=UPI0015860A7E|nr:hypothetical protein [Pseudomonas lundensis]